MAAVSRLRKRGLLPSLYSYIYEQLRERRRLFFIPFALMFLIAGTTVSLTDKEDRFEVWADFADPKLYPILGAATWFYLYIANYRAGLTRRTHLMLLLEATIGTIAAWGIYFLSTVELMGELALLENGKYSILSPLLDGEIWIFFENLLSTHSMWLTFVIGIHIMQMSMQWMLNDSLNRNMDRDLTTRIVRRSYYLVSGPILHSDKSYEQFDITFTNELLSRKNAFLSRIRCNNPFRKHSES